MKKRATKRVGKAGEKILKKNAALPADFIYFPFSTIILSAIFGNGNDFKGRQARRRGKTGMP